jgi:hypothetical protein
MRIAQSLARSFCLVRSFLHFVFLLFALVSLAMGCGEEKSLDPGVCPAEIPTFTTGDATGHAAPLGASAGQSRAGRLLEAELPEDRLGLGVWAAGDFVLANDRVALVIEDVGASDLFDPHGGRPVGIARVENGKLVDAGNFNEILMGIATYIVKTESVTVLNDGSDGTAAIVRAVGPLVPVEFLGDLLKTVIPGSYDGLPAAIDYVMEPGSDGVDVYVEVANPEAESRGVRSVLLGFFQPNRMPSWTEASGFATATSPLPMTAFIDDDGVSFAWLASEERELQRLLEIAGALAFTTGSMTLSPCTTTRLKLGTMVLGSGLGLPGLQSSLARLRGETLRTVVGSVIDAEENEGGPATDVRVHVLRADGSHFSRLRPDETGAFETEVPHETVTFVAYRDGTSVSAPVAVTTASDTVGLVMPAYATLDVVVTEESQAELIPARVQVLPQAPLSAPSVPAEYGERSLASGRSHIAFAMAEAVKLRVDPGDHRVVVSRGFEYELKDDLVTAVSAGETRELGYALAREVDIPGVMCADYHIHTHRSPDSPDSPQLKLAAMIADGLEIPIRSDHEWIRDFDPVIYEMGLEAYAFGVGGEELTTFTWGHFNVFPLEENPAMRNGGAIEWIGRLPPEVFAEVRARSESPSLIINHPRSGGAPGGYFSAAGLDSTTGMVLNPDHWDEEFTLVEVFNDGDFEDFRDSVVADWFALLNSGRRVFAVGSSDSHAVRSSPVGYPRTCLILGVDDVPALRARGDRVDLIQDTTAAGRSTISGGAYLTVVGPDGSQPGDDVALGGGDASFEVRVHAAAWVRGLDYVEVIVDGQTIDVIPIEAEPTEPPDPSDPAVRFARDIVIASSAISAQGSWVIFHVGSDGMDGLLEPVHPGGHRRPFAVSNPIFLSP